MVQMIAVLPDIRVLRPLPNTAVVECVGEHDITTAPNLEELLLRLLADNELVVLDLTEATFIDSSILFCITKAQNLSSNPDKRFTLQLGPRSVVQQALEVSGVRELVDVAHSREDALHS